MQTHELLQTMNNKLDRIEQNQKRLAELEKNHAACKAATSTRLDSLENDKIQTRSDFWKKIGIVVTIITLSISAIGSVVYNVAFTESYVKSLSKEVEQNRQDIYKFGEKIERNIENIAKNTD